MILELLLAISIGSARIQLSPDAHGADQAPAWVWVALDRGNSFLRAAILHNQSGGLRGGGDVQPLVPPPGAVAAGRGKSAVRFPGDYDRAPLRDAKHESILRRIYLLESSSGKRDSCLARGGVNGFGWNSNKTCFPDFPTAVETVDRRIGALLSAYPLRQALCVYNTGKPRGGECCYAYSYLGTRPGSGSLLTC